MYFRLMKNKTVEPTSVTSTESDVENNCIRNAHSEKKEGSAEAVIVLAVFTAICFVAFLAIFIVYLIKTRHGNLQLKNIKYIEIMYVVLNI